MPAFFDYLRNITYYLLFAALVGLIAPTGKYKKFVSLVMGLVMLALLLQPIRDIVGNHIPVTQWFVGVMPQHSYGFTADDAYTTWRDTYLAAAFDSQLSTQLEGLLERNGITMHTASFEYTSDFSQITSITVQVSQRQQDSRRVPFIRIEPIQTQQQEAPEDPLITEVKNLVAGFYNLPGSHIYVEVLR
ncbi:MAG: stage III sporulation protein AF [Defluviitaleaceae bacterium]|nr:stage III sporulation protein AF [Defluviitaleaceae bacterium]